ncbi:MAG: glycosyltransferase family 2 protein [Thainema sp.]
MANSDRPFISVIIPVFNDGERLQLCLAALAQQTYPRSHVEVIVVDNGSDPLDPIKAAVESYDNVILTFEATPGSYAARNQGIALAKGEVIAFTDADCIPVPDWLAKGAAQLDEVPNCGMVSGKVEVFFKRADQPTTVELYQSMTAFPQEFYLKQFRGGVTANLFTWSKVIDQVGLFDQRLKSFGDLEWGRRVYLAGYQQVYAADVVVNHPARHTWNQLYQRTIRTAGGVYDHFIQREPSWLKRYLMFGHLFAEDLIPPVNFTITTFRNPAVKGFTRKVKVSLMLLVIRYINAWEKIRLLLGGVSIRE